MDGQNVVTDTARGPKIARENTCPGNEFPGNDYTERFHPQNDREAFGSTRRQAREISCKYTSRLWLYLIFITLLRCHGISVIC